MPGRFIAAICLIAIFASAGFAAPQGIKPIESWAGKIKESPLRKLAPKSGFIADAKAWEELWTAWRPGKDLPEVDFSQSLILVGIVPGPNLVIMVPMMDEQGNVKFVVGGTKIGGPGFGYKFVKIAKEGVKTINGKSIEAHGVQGELEIPKKVDSFEDRIVEIKLWEYDPRLADASATLIDEVIEKNFEHQQGEETRFSFSLGQDLKPKQDFHYYITVFILEDGNRTHIGEIEGKSGLGKVVPDGKQAPVKVIVRSVGSQR
ncbi:hypothetical protein GC197_17360 [bacterium]|nr:hypothetical protein [bacterium]